MPRGEANVIDWSHDEGAELSPEEIRMQESWENAVARGLVDEIHALCRSRCSPPREVIEMGFAHKAPLQVIQPILGAVGALGPAWTMNPLGGEGAPAGPRCGSPFVFTELEEATWFAIVEREDFEAVAVAQLARDVTVNPPPASVLESGFRYSRHPRVMHILLDNYRIDSHGNGSAQGAHGCSTAGDTASTAPMGLVGGSVQQAVPEMPRQILRLPTSVWTEWVRRIGRAAVDRAMRAAGGSGLLREKFDDVDQGVTFEIFTIGEASPEQNTDVRQPARAYSPKSVGERALALFELALGACEHNEPALVNELWAAAVRTRAPAVVRALREHGVPLPTTPRGEESGNDVHKSPSTSIAAVASAAAAAVAAASESLGGKFDPYFHPRRVTGGALLTEVARLSPDTLVAEEMDNLMASPKTDKAALSGVARTAGAILQDELLFELVQCEAVRAHLEAHSEADRAAANQPAAAAAALAAATAAAIADAAAATNISTDKSGVFAKAPRANSTDVHSSTLEVPSEHDEPVVDVDLNVVSAAVKSALDARHIHSLGVTARILGRGALRAQGKPVHCPTLATVQPLPDLRILFQVEADKVPNKPDPLLAPFDGFWRRAPMARPSPTGAVAKATEGGTVGAVAAAAAAAAVARSTRGFSKAVAATASLAAFEAAVAKATFTVSNGVLRWPAEFTCSPSAIRPHRDQPGAVELCLGTTSFSARLEADPNVPGISLLFLSDGDVWVRDARKLM
eukprot:TRINITY_DN69074_c0_g1_i1.p1 TRINITY_DN69074_c0_g1~~TRINITY_DN69074_c0_g1_i1.p1  ORF type:complete len:766 (-),score=131.27 TRINITY_DN69074_c0_g1_i1:103-2328(-)